MAGPSRDMVICLHGFAMVSPLMLPLRRGLSKAGYRTAAPDYPSRLRSLDDITRLLLPKIERWDGEGRTIHFVTHSMGGLVARALIARYRPASLGKVVMLAPPNGGSEWVAALEKLRIADIFFGPAKDLLAIDRPDALDAVLGEVDYPLGIIAGNAPTGNIVGKRLFPGPHDGKVTVSSTHLEGERDHVVLPVSHSRIFADRDVHRQIVSFLENGRFLTD